MRFDGGWKLGPFYEVPPCSGGNVKVQRGGSKQMGTPVYLVCPPGWGLSHPLTTRYCLTCGGVQGRGSWNLKKGK